MATRDTGGQQRATRSRDISAPNISELFGARVRGFATTVTFDALSAPLEGAHRGPGTDHDSP